MTCSRCGGSVPNPTCYVCAEDECFPWSEGEAAFFAGQPKTANPHSGDNAADWEEGWEYAERCAQEDPVIQPK